jgi:hypothetical protein
MGEGVRAYVIGMCIRVRMAVGKSQKNRGARSGTIPPISNEPRFRGGGAPRRTGGEPTTPMYLSNLLSL